MRRGSNAAFGRHLGPQSRWVGTALTVVALVIPGRLYQATRRGDTPRVLALAPVRAGASGNLVDRLRSELGAATWQSSRASTSPTGTPFAGAVPAGPGESV